MRDFHLLPVLAVAAVLAALFGCDSPSAPRTPSSLQAAGGLGSSGTAGAVLIDSARVIVLDANGNPIRGAEVTWTASGGTASPAKSVTGMDGMSSTQWTLGTQAGTQTLTARAGTVTTQFVVTAAPGPAAQVVVTPATLSLVVGEQRTLTAAVTDAYGNPVTANVQWSSSASGVVASPGASVRAVAAGTARLTATVAGVGTSHTDITVTRPVIASLSRGSNYWTMCALDSGGNAYCWGRSDFGNAGQHPGDALRPARIGGGRQFTKVSTGGGTACGLTACGQVYCWGSVGYDGQAVVSVAPVLAAGGSAFTDISLGGGGGRCGISDGGLYCWTTSVTHQPTPAAPGTFTAVSSSSGTTCALAANGVPWCWGDNSYLQLGRDWTGCTSPSRFRYTCDTPQPITTGQAFAQVQTAEYNTCGRTHGGTWYCWGSNFVGQLTQPAPATCGGRITNPSYKEQCSATPLQVQTTPVLVQVEPGWNSACGLTAAGAAYCWGSGSRGQLGNGSTDSSGPTPVPVAGGHTFTSLSAGDTQYYCGVTTAGQVYCWGSGEHGQLGNGSTSDSAMSVPVF